MTSTGDLALLLQLLQVAFGEFSSSAPVVVASEAGLQLEHQWQSRETESPVDFAAIASELLQDGPVLALPPWSGAKTTGQRQAAFETVLLAIPPARSDVTLAAVLPSYALTSNAGRAFRERMSESWQPVLVLHALVSDALNMDLAVVFWLPSSTLKPLKMFRLPRTADGEVIHQDFRKLLKRGDGTVEFGYVLPARPDPGERLSFEINHPAAVSRIKELDVWGTPARLGDLFEARGPGWRPGRDEPVSEVPGPGLIRLLAGRDIRRDGTLAEQDESSRWAEVPPDRQLRAGDIVLPRVFSIRVASDIAVAEVTADDLPLAAAPSVVTLRQIADLSPPQHLMVLLFLRASRMMSPYAATIKGHATISSSVLSDIRVPQPDAALAATIEGLEATRIRLEQWRNDAVALLGSVYEDESAVDARRRIMQSGRLLRMRVDAADLLDDFGHQVRSRYPYPIAYRWSRAQVLLSNGADSAAYDAILEAAEVLLCFCALATMALVQSGGLRIGAIGEIRRRLSSGGTRGPGLGDWTNILQEVATGRAFRRLAEDDPLTEFRDAFIGTEAIAARQALATRRNDEAHLRHVEVEDLPSAIAEAQSDLITLLKRVSFLADLPLVQVNNVRWDSLRKTARVEYVELTGDNALFPGKVRVYPSNELEVGSLYLATENGNLHLLRPFILRRRCPKCREWETFHIDNAPNAPVVQIKSLERGHLLQEPDQWEAFEHVGLVETNTRRE